MGAQYHTLNVACGYVLFLLTFVIISTSSIFASQFESRNKSTQNVGVKTKQPKPIAI
jgi:hypothetical protein